MAQVLKLPPAARSNALINSLVPFIRHLQFFKSRGLKDNEIGEILSMMTYQEVEKDKFVMEYGQLGEEFFVILEGQCEIMVPDSKREEYR